VEADAFVSQGRWSGAWLRRLRVRSAGFGSQAHHGTKCGRL